MSLMSEQEVNIKKAKCPNCKSKKKTQVIGAPSFAFADPIGTDRYNNSHTYRFQHAQDKKGGTRDQRKAAAAASKVGANPYPFIDDISSGKNFGEVK